MVETLVLSPEIAAARAKWLWRGQQRPAFAEPTAPGEESVWDFPRPPRMEPVDEAIRVEDGAGRIVAETSQGVRVCETAGAPTYYFPPADVEHALLEREGEGSLCEWKGIAVSFAVSGSPGQAWSYERVFAEFTAIRGWLAFYPSLLACFIGAERVTPQPGGYYGGWVLRRLKGPIKGEPGSGSW